MARVLRAIGVLTPIDRAALAAYCQGYAKWVEAEQKLKKTPPLLKSPSGYIQQSPWMAIANKQLELMGRYMTELGMTTASRSRVGTDPRMQLPPTITFATVYEAKPSNTLDVKLGNPNGAAALRRAGRGGAPLREAIARNADRHAQHLALVVEDVRDGGASSLRAIAAELNTRGMLIRRGGLWHVSTVKNLIDRIGRWEAACASPA